MAGFRQIHTKIWKDEWYIELSAEEKLLFIYLFSNDEASISGLYKLPIRVMMNETGLSRETIEAALGTFEATGKVFYRDGVVWVVHMTRYHANASATTRKKLQTDVARIPDCELKRMYLYGMDTPSIPHPYPMDASSQNDVKEEEEDKDKEEDVDQNNDDIGSLSPLSAAFVNETGIPELTGGPEKWVKALEAMEKAGVIASDVTTAIQELREKSYQIVSIQSVVNPAINVMSRRKSARSNNRSSGQEMTGPNGERYVL